MPRNFITLWKGALKGMPRGKFPWGKSSHLAIAWLFPSCFIQKLISVTDLTILLVSVHIVLCKSLNEYQLKINRVISRTFQFLSNSLELFTWLAVCLYRTMGIMSKNKSILVQNFIFKKVSHRYVQHNNTPFYVWQVGHFSGECIYAVHCTLKWFT